MNVECGRREPVTGVSVSWTGGNSGWGRRACLFCSTRGRPIQASRGPTLPPATYPVSRAEGPATVDLRLEGAGTIDTFAEEGDDAPGAGRADAAAEDSPAPMASNAVRCDALL